VTVHTVHKPLYLWNIEGTAALFVYGGFGFVYGLPIRRSVADRKRAVLTNNSGTVWDIVG